MHEFWYDYVKQKYGENEKLCYMNTDSVLSKINLNFKIIKTV